MWCFAAQGFGGLGFRVCQTKARFCGRASACRLTHPRATHLQLSGHTALYVSRTSKQIHARLKKECVFGPGSSQWSVFSAPDLLNAVTEVFREG